MSRRAGWRGVLGAAVVVCAFVVPSGHANAATPGDCTFIGGPGPDTPPVGDARDVLCTRGGNDVIRPSAGNDVVRAGAGRDLVDGGAGKDRLSGGGGADLLEGSAGGDRVYGDGGGDTMRGSGGFDRLWGEADGDTLDGGEDTIADVLRGGPGPDRAARHRDDVVDSAILSDLFCQGQMFYPCATSYNYANGPSWGVTEAHDCGGDYAPTSLTFYLENDEWACDSNTGSFQYLDSVTGVRFEVDSEIPKGLFYDPYLTCAFTDYQTAGAGTPVPPYACVPNFTGDGVWPLSEMALVEQGDTSQGLAAGQSCDIPPQGSGECPGIGTMQASNEGQIWVLNNGNTGVCVNLLVNGGSYDRECLNNPGDTWGTDIKSGATVGADNLDDQQTGQILITYVQSWGHNTVHTVRGGG
jgi:hypothetical protein